MGSPNVSISLLPAAVVSAFGNRRNLVVGLQAGGSAAGGALVRDVHLLSTTEIATQFGTGDLYYRIQLWKAANGSYSPLDVLPISAGAGSASSAGTIQAAGTATESSSIVVEAIDGNLFKKTISISSGLTANDAATAINAAFSTSSNPRFAFTPSVATDTVTFTSKDTSTFADNAGIRVTGSVAGLTFTVTNFTGGNNGTITTTGILDQISGIRYTGISLAKHLPEAFRTEVITLLGTRFNAANTIMDGVAFMGSNDTKTNNDTLVSTLNSQSFVIMGNNTVSNEPVILQPADWSSAYFMGVRSRRLATGSPISDFVIATNGPLDAFGGPHTASLPYFNTPLAQTQVTQATNLYSGNDMSELEEDGFTSFGVNASGNSMIMNDVVTTWTTDSAGNVNDSFHYLNYVDTGSVCREIFFNILKSTYAQSRLTEGDLIPGYSMANQESIQARLLRIYKTLSGISLTQAGPEAEANFSQNTTVTISLSTRSVSISGPLTIVTQAGSFTYALQLSFQVGGSSSTVTF